MHGKMGIRNIASNNLINHMIWQDTAGPTRASVIQLILPFPDDQF